MRVMRRKIRTAAAGFPGRFRSRLHASATLALAGSALLGANSRVTGNAESRDITRPENTPPSLPSNSCIHCHVIDQTFSHPVNFAPSRALSPEFPLEDGLFTCTTCHNVVGPRHRNRQGAPDVRTGATGTAFCAQCHNHTELSRASSHAFVLGVAHMNLPNADSTVPPGFSSNSCLTCHDGSLVTNLNHPGRPIADFTSGTHPFGVDYHSTGPDAFDGPLAPISSLDTRIRLSHGRVDCGSCHSLYSPIDNLLVMDNHGSALCLNCHQY